MRKILGLLVLTLVAGVGGLALAQEEARTPEELAKLPMYQRLLKGDDAKEATELEQSFDGALEAEDWAEAKKHAQALLDLRIAKQGADHYEVTGARQLLPRVEILAGLTAEEWQKVEQVNQQDQQLLQHYQQGQYQQAAEIGELVLGTRKKLLGENHPYYATSLNNLARLYSSMGEYAKAEPLYLHACDLRKKLLGESHPDYANSLSGLATLYSSMGEYAKAEPLFLQARDLYKKLLGENHPDYATSLSSLAVLYQSIGEYTKAEPLMVQAHDLHSQLLGENHPSYARSLTNLAALYSSMGEYAKAKPLYLQVCALRKKLMGENHPDYARSLNNLAALYVKMGEYAKAEPLYVQARDLLKKLLGENHPSYATSLNNLAGLYEAMGEYAEAEPLYLQSRDLYKTLLGENHPDYARSLNNLAGLYKAMGEYAKAEPLHLQAHDLRKKFQGENHPDYAASLSSLAGLYKEMGEYAKAEPLDLQARDLYKKLLGENHPDYANSLNSLALLNQSMGEYAKAEPLYLQARNLVKKLLGENHPDYAISLANLAGLYHLMGEYAKAEPLLVQARDLYKRLLGENHPAYATILNNLANLYQSMGEYAKAEPLLVQARDLVKERLGENHPDYANSLNSLALLNQSMGEYAKAEPLLVQARDLVKERLGENHPDYTTNLKNLANLYQSNGEYAKAEPLMLECARSYEMSRIARAGGFQRAIGGEGGNPYLALASVSARLKKPQQGFVALEFNLARAFLDVQAQRLGQTLNADQQAGQSLIVNKLSPIEKRIAVLVGRTELTEEETQELAEQIAARRKLNVELAQLAAELSTQEVSDFDAIQQTIPASLALLTWIDVFSKGGVNEHWACVLTSSGEPFWVPLPGSGENGKWTEEDKRLAATFRDAVAQPVPPSNLPELTEQLRRQRIEPLLAHLKEHGITQLYVVGVEQMAGLPVEVIAPEFTISYVPSGTFLARLPSKPKFENTLFAVGDPFYEVKKAKQKELTSLPPHGLLIETLAPGGKAAELGLNPGQVLLQYAETKLTTIDELKAAIQKALEAGATTAAVTVWKVDDVDKPSEQVVEFSVGPLGVILAPDPAPLALANRRESEALFASLRGGEVWNDLPGTRYEVQRLRELFPTATVLLDGNANEAAVDALRQSGDLGQFRYLHFATHGKGNNITAFESKLILSQDQPNGEIKPGEPWYNNEVSAREVLDFWKLNADLVTLSACQTGLGRQGGGEGLLGFAQAFLLSGSRSVCLSLWEVDDIATALLMQRFYQNLLGQREGLTVPMPKAKALEEAKQWLRNLTAAEATAMTAQLTGGIARGTREEKTFKVPPPSTPAEVAAGDDYKPYARPHYWSAFILIGESE